MSSRLLCLLAVAATLGSAAAAPPDPADPLATTPAPIVKPPVPASGAAVADPGVGDWRQANRRVHEAGGWRALLRESQAANAPAPPPASPVRPAAASSVPASAASAASAAPVPASATSAPAGGHHHH